MSAWLVLALVVIVSGGFAILRRLHLLRVALGFWASFAVGIGILALAGHSMTARWHLGPISGFHLWSVLITSPEVLVFLFFMITDPKTAPRSPNGRLAYAVSLGLLAGVLIVGTAISEIWFSLDNAGQWLFGIYGAAAAIALLGIFAFYLASVAELPPPPPKPLKPKKAKQGRRGRKAAAEATEDASDEEATEDAADEVADETPEAEEESESDEKPAEVTAASTDAAEPESTAEEPVPADEPEAESTNGRLRNRRRRRLRGGVAVED